MWNDNFLTIVFRPALARHVLDAGFSASTIALGCLVESLRIAASASGFSAQFNFLGLTEQDAACAEIHFLAGGGPPDPLYSALAQRTTDRRPYRQGVMPAADLTAIWQEFDGSNAARFDCTESISGDLLDFIVSAESLIARHSSIFPDTLPWIRLSRKEVLRTKDGMPWYGTGVSTLEYPALALMHVFPRSFQLFKAAMGPSQTAQLKKLLRSSAGLLCISTLEEGPPTLLAAGRLAMRLWLRLTQLGYGVQPLTISSLLMYNAKHGMLDPETRRLFGARYPEGERIFRDRFGLAENAQPVWLLRTGISSPLPPAWRTLRREVVLESA